MVLLLPSGVLFVEVGGQVGVGAGDAELAGPFIGHGEQAADPARHRVLRHRRLREVAELVEARIAVAEAQLAGVAQVVGHLIDRKSTRLNSSHVKISYAVVWLK